MTRAPYVGELGLAARLLRHWSRRNRDNVADIVKAKLYITKLCNLECRHCGIGAAGFDGSDELTTAQIRRLWEHNRSLQLVSFSGGEPFVRTDLTDVALHAVRVLPRLLTLSVNTNGWHTDRILELAETVGAELGKRRELFVTCSSEGPKKTHVKVRGSEESYERKEETLAQLRALRQRVPALEIRHNININRWNLGEIEDYVASLEDRGEQCLLSLYSASKHYAHDSSHFKELELFRKELSSRNDLLRRLSNRPSFLTNRFLTLAQGFYDSEERSQPLPCFSLRASVIIEPDGMVRPCINFPVDLGRIQDHGFQLSSVTRTQQGDDLRKKIRCEECPICWTPNEAYVTMMCNLPNPALWRDPLPALRRLGLLRS